MMDEGNLHVTQINLDNAELIELVKKLKKETEDRSSDAFALHSKHEDRGEDGEGIQKPCFKSAAESESLDIKGAMPESAIDTTSRGRSVLPESEEDGLPKRIPQPRGGSTVLGKAGLTSAEISRYSRHLLVPAVGVSGQRNVISKSCVVIGAGALASAVLPYLAGAGMGRIGIVDFDRIEKSNLHRQVLFREFQEGRGKAVCAAAAVNGINSGVSCTTFEVALSHENALELLGGFDVVVDASDNPRTRYLVNDACVLLGKPLISGSALGMEGQVTVYHYLDGPCYRCVFPSPLAVEAGRRCSDNGVLGTVPGVIGCLQATEALKVAGEFGTPLSQKLCMYDAQDGSFYTVKLPPRCKSCKVCGNNASITSMEDSRLFAVSHGLAAVEGSGTGGLTAVDGEGEKGTTSGGRDAQSVPSVSCQEYSLVRERGEDHLLLDVRSTVQFDMCALQGAMNIPLRDLELSLSRVEVLSRSGTVPIYCMCRRGVDSRTATILLSNKGFDSVKDVEGGLQRWSRDVDKSFPTY